MHIRIFRSSSASNLRSVTPKKKKLNSQPANARRLFSNLLDRTARQIRIGELHTRSNLL